MQIKLKPIKSLLAIATMAMCVCPIVAPAAPISRLNFDGHLEGSSLTVDVVISNATDLFALNLDIAYEPEFLRFRGVTAGNFLQSGGPTLGQLFPLTAEVSDLGELQNINDSLLGNLPGVSGDGVLAKLMFDVVGSGVTTLRFIALNLLAGTEFVDSFGEALTIGESLPIALEVQAVPEPNSILLTVLGLSCFCSFWLKRDS